MGVDLALIIPTSPIKKDRSVLGLNVLWLDRDSDLWDKIKKIQSYSVAPNILESYWHYDEKLKISTFGEMSEDPYGSPLRYVYAKDLYKYMIVYMANNGVSSTFNKAIAYFLQGLDADYPIILYWH